MEKKTNVKGAHTPANMTHLMVAKLGFNLEQFDSYSNAYLATMEEFIPGPIWCMDLYCGQHVYRAIFEEFSLNIYIYYGQEKPMRLIDQGQEWVRIVHRKDRRIRQRGYVFSNRRLEPCLHWVPMEA